MYARPTTHNSPALFQRKSQSSPSSLHRRDGGFLVMKAVPLSWFSWVRVSTVLLCRFSLSRIHKRLCRGIPNFDSRRKRKRSACGHRELLCKSHVCELDDCSTCRSLGRGGGARPWTLITEECYFCLSFTEYTNTSSAKPGPRRDIEYCPQAGSDAKTKHREQRAICGILSAAGQTFHPGCIFQKSLAFFWRRQRAFEMDSIST